MSFRYIIAEKIIVFLYFLEGHKLISNVSYCYVSAS